MAKLSREPIDETLLQPGPISTGFPDPLIGAVPNTYFPTLLKDKALNTMEICRFVNQRPNGFCRRKIAAQNGHARTGFNRCKMARCHYHYGFVVRWLKRLEQDGKILSRKMRFWDFPHRSDLYKFWFVDPKVLEKRLRLETLIHFLLHEPIANLMAKEETGA